MTAVALLGAACGGGSSLKQGAGSNAQSAPAASNEAAPPSAAPSQAQAPTDQGAAAVPGPAGQTAAQGPAGKPGTPAAAKAGAPGQRPKAGGKALPGAPAAPGSPSPGAPAPGGKQNYNSDVGVTKDVIKIGIINMASASRSLGPIIAQASERVTDSAVKYINRNGGVAGRQLQLVACDDGGDVSRARACYEKLKGQVFAFVPSETWVTDVVHDRLVKDKVPWMSWGWFKSEYEDPWMFPCHANGMRESHALAKWLVGKFQPKTIGILYLNVAEDIAARDVARKYFESKGVKVVQQIAQEWDSPDESQHVLAMRAANPDIIVSFSWPAPVAKFMHDARAQNYAPPVGYAANHLTGDPGYGPIFSDYIKDRTYTITSWIVPGDEDLPELRLFAQETQRNYGKDFFGFHFRYAYGHHISQSAWVCTRIFAKAAATLGPDLTRAAFKDVLESNSYDSGMGVTLYWPKGDHNKEPYSFNREFIYKWVTASDGGYDLKRTPPDPTYSGG